MDRPPPVSLFSRLRGNSHKRSTSSGRHGSNNGYESDAEHRTGPEWQKETRRGRSSLSALDQKREEAMRRDIMAFLHAEPPPSQHIGQHGASGSRTSRISSTTKSKTKALEKEEDYLAAFGRSPFRRPAHQRHASASASFAQRSHADLSLLRPPPRFPGRPSSPLPSSSSSFSSSRSPIASNSTATSSIHTAPGRTRVAAVPVFAAPAHRPLHASSRPPIAPNPAAANALSNSGYRLESHSNYGARNTSDLYEAHGRDLDWIERGRQQQSLQDFILRTDRANARAMHSSGPNPGPGAGGVGGGTTSLFTPSDTLIMNEGLPESSRASIYTNRPRRLSGSSNASSSYESTSNSTPRESFESRMRSSSWGSQTSFESFYSAHSTKQQRASFTDFSQFPWQRPAPIKQPVRRKSKPGELFSVLPGDVLDLIFAHLKKLHLAPGSTSCATCWMRDACSAALSSRKMLRHARGALYEDIQLVGADSAQHRKKYKTTGGTRITLLRRTLRGDPKLAMIVKSLKVPAIPPNSGMEAEYLDIVASLVMACPNLERVVGFYPRYDHLFNRYFHALSTRQRLKEMVWVVEPTQFQRQHRVRASSGSLTKMMQPKSSQTQLQALAQRQAQASGSGGLHPKQVAGFLELHSNWQFLSTLAIHCQPGATPMPPTLVVRSLAYLPGLQNLHLSHLPASAFDDNSLVSLPALKRLTLVHLAGLTSAGLSTFASRANGSKLEALTIVHCRLDCLKVLARILSNLRSLACFSLVQSNPPALPDGEDIWLFPYVASASLRQLHWDIPASAERGTTTDSILAQSIEAGGFPALRRLRVPNDPEGWFQKLCRPQEKADLPGDRYRGGRQHHLSSHSRSSSYSPSSHQSGQVDGSKDSRKMRPEFSDLHQARLAAQARIEGSSRMPRFLVNVIDEDGLLVEKYGIAAFVGSVESCISYHLLPDPGATDERGGLVGIAELLGDGGEDLASRGDGDENSKREGCAGRWNAFSSVSHDKKDKDRWAHTERGRWRGVTLG